MGWTKYLEKAEENGWMEKLRTPPSTINYNIHLN